MVVQANRKRWLITAAAGVGIAAIVALAAVVWLRTGVKGWQNVRVETAKPKAFGELPSAQFKTKSAAGQRQQHSKLALEWSGEKFPSFPKDLPVYQEKPLDLDKDTAAEIGKAFGFEELAGNQPEQETRAGYRVYRFGGAPKTDLQSRTSSTGPVSQADRNAEVRSLELLEATRQYRFRVASPSAFMGGAKAPPANRAKQEATEFLETAGVLPAETTAELYAPGSSLGSGSSTRTTVRRIANGPRIITFTRRIDGYTLVDDLGRPERREAMVMVGTDIKVINAAGAIPTDLVKSEYRLKTAKAAFREAKEGKWRGLRGLNALWTAFSPGRRVISGRPAIKGAKLVLSSASLAYERFRGKDQTSYLEPVFVFKGKLIVDGRGRDYSIAVPAVAR